MARISDLAIRTVDPSGNLPLYHQIEADLRRLIREGVFPADELLPTEVELSKLYGVGRQTVRLALSRLVADDLIQRQPGKGTCIKPQTNRVSFYLDRSFTRQMADLGLVAHSRVLSQSVGVIDKTMPASLRAHQDEQVMHLTRLRFGDETPVGLQVSRVVLTLCPGLEKRDFSKASLYETLASEFRLTVRRIDHRIRAAAADDLQAGLLKVASGAPLLVVRTTAYLQDGNVIEDTTSYYRADKYEYHTSHRYTGESE